MRHRLVGGEWVPVDRLAPSRERFPEISIQKDCEFVSHSLPRHWPYARDWDAQGRPRFNGPRDVREAVARSRDTRHDHVEYS